MNRVAWVYFCYEGIFKFCKDCGCVGHNTSRCPLSLYKAQRLISSHMQDFEDHGMLVLQTHEGFPLYSNLVRGLIDQFIHRNPRVNLLRMRPFLPPSQDPYLFPHLYMQGQFSSDSSSDEFFYASPGFVRDVEKFQNISRVVFDNAVYPSQYEHHPHPVNVNSQINARPSPGRRFGLGPDTSGFEIPTSQNINEPNTNLDLK